MHIVTWSSGTLCFCMPSSVRWTMAPSRIFSLHLPLFSQLYPIGSVDCCEASTFGQDCGPIEGEGGGARGGGVRRR